MEEIFSVIGAGGWGTTLALVMCRKGYKVKLWTRTENQCKDIKEKKMNEKYLPGVYIPPELEVSHNLQEVVKYSRLIVMAVPSHGFRTIISRAKEFISKDTILVSATKGIETDTLLRMSEVLQEEMGPGHNPNIAVISGPNHAEEVSREIPSATVVASKRRSTAEFVQETFMCPYFRVYTNPDMVGVELGGALKNIIALASGASDGLGFGDNTKAALMTRGLTEISRLGIEMGANPLTFAGLAGVGDLIVTCTSRHSRNRKAGMLLGEGYGLEQVMEQMQMAVEGVKTTKAACKLAEKYGIEMPITRQLYDVLFQGKSPHQGVSELMLRGKKHEMEEIANQGVSGW
ncbi:NAD(P)H-dependent glycerol-3-phosphate dehydrogenase [Candidatus Contubernalis alkaliaceticus]|uniref:NAD(P)H-dependent glycerol-3-phosphate dehydrogenase n=1 Tax=Candidatus Contubernalis alkaliaceticus TaxID=338645 RepID=UPI001F4BD182|nr:NAD(P)H-dependent glycerol-3-phosphate dehydrogenase [Candidatus Contubernalis alkalaceticus]UNC92470.1 NAD(P)H-dependent glycerol-3-phosphate dehydrogenase [Candidatus Contubernalis alkalaceticus]